MTTDMSLMTLEDFLALPDDSKERWLVNGQLREKDDAMTFRNRQHSWTVGRITHLLWNWLESRPEPRGAIYAGEVGCILRHDPDTFVGIDVAYFAPDVVERQTHQTTLIDGVPVLAVEVLSPSDKQWEVHEKVTLYCEIGTRCVWVVDLLFRTVQVHRRGLPPQSFNEEQRLSGGDLLPGLELSVADFFSPRPAVP